MAKKLKDTVVAPPIEAGALVKPVLSKHKKYRASRVRHAQAHEDGTFSFSFVHVQVGNMAGKSLTRKCTKQVYEKVYGRHAGNDPTTAPSGGYAQTAGRLFFIYENPDTGIVEAITVGPGMFYSSRANAPEMLQDQSLLETTFYPATGGFEVVYRRGVKGEWQLPVMPGDMREAEFIQLVSNLDKEYQIYPGQQITPEFTVSSVAGNRVTFSR